MLILRVGDPHVKVTNLEESEKLMQFVLDSARKNKVDRVELLGDLFHTHAIIRLEVLDFWDRWLEKIGKEFELIVLVGNHDQSGDKNSKLHAMRVFRNLKSVTMTVVDESWSSGSIAYLSYQHDAETFIEKANALAQTSGAKVLVCHQTFKEAKFESGMYAPDGIDASLVNFPIIISGHIHSRQRFGKVIYPGTARWDTSADANEIKGLWLVTHDGTGAISKEEFLDTSHVCSPIVSVKWLEGDPEPVLTPGTRVSVELIGSSTWVSQKKAILKGRASISSKITDKKHSERRKSGENLEFFVKNLYVTTVNRDKLVEYMQELKIL